MGAAVDGLLLEPDGKLCALLRVTRTGEETFVLDVEAGFGEAVAARLRRFLLRSKVELEHLDWSCRSLRGTDIAAAVAPLASPLRGEGVWTLPFSWNGWSGVDLLGPGAAVVNDLVVELVHELAAGLGVQVIECGAEAVEACRIASGIPAMGAELTGRTIAAEADLVGRTVSFTKGCYTGQELVARIDARGSNVARRLVGLVDPGGPLEGTAGALVTGMTLHAGDPPAEDAATGDKVVGTVTSAAWSTELGSWIALAYLHRSVSVPGPVRARSGDGVGGSRPIRAELLPLPGVPRPSAD